MTCKESQQLTDGACTQSWITKVQGSMQGLVLGLVVLCSLLLLVIGEWHPLFPFPIGKLALWCCADFPSDAWPCAVLISHQTALWCCADFPSDSLVVLC